MVSIRNAPDITCATVGPKTATDGIKEGFRRYLNIITCSGIPYERTELVNNPPAKQVALRGL